ncbi:hypothetical protein [Candidatus Pelagibacter sp. Uisw_130]|uniref:hypothetical protein n=1 Tax=Candidatus Pelagibacter sp. Uisw_130 TaxID=3230989 RepID=UPI0039ED1B1F
MKYLILIFLFILSSCNLDRNSINLNNETIKETKTSSVDVQDADFKEMSFDEFESFLKEYSKNSDYPDINN